MYMCSSWVVHEYKPALPGSFKYRYLLFLGHSSMYSCCSLVIQVCIEAQSYIYVFALRHTSSMYICSYCITHSYICSTWIAQTNFHSKVMQVYIPALTNICFSWVIQVYNTCSSWFIQYVYLLLLSHTNMYTCYYWVILVCNIGSYNNVNLFVLSHTSMFTPTLTESYKNVIPAFPESYT